MSYQRRHKSYYYYEAFRVGYKVFNIYVCDGRLGYALACMHAENQRRNALHRQYIRAVKEAEQERRRFEREARKAGNPGGRRGSE
jgi:hypothetical protein